jgi:hypothetical protein
LYFKIKVFVVSKIWYFNKSIYFYFPKIWVATKRRRQRRQLLHLLQSVIPFATFDGGVCYNRRQRLLQAAAKRLLLLHASDVCYMLRRQVVHVGAMVPVTLQGGERWCYQRPMMVLRPAGDGAT